jgi:hypothetical protein
MQIVLMSSVVPKGNLNFIGHHHRSLYILMGYTAFLLHTDPVFYCKAEWSYEERSDNGNLEIYVFLKKYLHDFQYKNMLRISMALAFDFT